MLAYITNPFYPPSVNSLIIRRRSGLRLHKTLHTVFQTTVYLVCTVPSKFAQGLGCVVPTEITTKMIKVFFVFFSPSKQLFGYYLEIYHDRFLPHYLFRHSLPSTLLPEQMENLLCKPRINRRYTAVLSSAPSIICFHFYISVCRHIGMSVNCKTAERTRLKGQKEASCCKLCNTERCSEELHARHLTRMLCSARGDRALNS